jgi:hypothetical protein
VEEQPRTWDENGNLVPLNTRERVRLHRTGDMRETEELYEANKAEPLPAHIARQLEKSLRNETRVLSP